MTVKTILSAKGGDVISIEPTATLETAVKTLAKHRIGALLVLGPDRRVIGILSERDIVRVLGEQGADVLAHRLVVVAGHEDHLHVVARALEDLLHHGVLRRGPVDAAAAHRPEVEDVTDEEQVLGLVGPQEIQQPLGLARRRAEVDIRQEDCTDVLCHGTYGKVSDMRYNFLTANYARCMTALLRLARLSRAKSGRS